MTDDGQIRQLVWRPSAHLAKRKGSTSWYWIDKPAYAKDREDCCSVDPISLHPTKEPQEMLKLWNKITGVGPFGTSVEDQYLRKVSEYYNERSKNHSRTV